MDCNGWPSATRNWRPAIARYRTKDQTDLDWNKIRRHITRTIDTAIQDQREELLNEVLTAAWEKYAQALETGEALELADEVTDLVKKMIIPVIPSAARVFDA